MRPDVLECMAIQPRQKTGSPYDFKHHPERCAPFVAHPSSPAATLQTGRSRERVFEGSGWRGLRLQAELFVTAKLSRNNAFC
jgi:hypothetical protein